MQGSHLINDAAKGPDIRLLIVLRFVYLFRAHVIRCAYMCVGKLRLLVHHTCEAKVTDLHIAIRI